MLRIAANLLVVTAFSGALTGCGGSIDVSMRTTATEAVVAVRDSGIGIPREKQDSIFEPFTQAEAARAGMAPARARLRAAVVIGVDRGLGPHRDARRARRVAEDLLELAHLAAVEGAVLDGLDGDEEHVGLDLAVRVSGRRRRRRGTG